MPAPWKLLYACVTGTSHVSSGQACQDCAQAGVLGAGSSPILIIACADGAGTALRAKIGARLACSAFYRAAAALLDEGLKVSEITEGHVLSWHDQTRRRLSLEACLSNLDLRDFACTLLTAIISDDAAVFSQIGDGVIVFREGDDYQWAFWPQSGEYANETNFITGCDFEKHLEFRSLGHGLKELAVTTDGLERLALSFRSRSVRADFFDSMLQSVRGCPDPEDLESALKQWLGSKSVNDRTDDDKTLVLATRRLPDDEQRQP